MDRRKKPDRTLITAGLLPAWGADASGREELRLLVPATGLDSTRDRIGCSWREAFGWCCVPKVTNAASERPYAYPSGILTGERIMRVFIICAIVVRAVVGLCCYYAETTPQQSLQAWMIEPAS
jgi:hypothetical protein